MKMNKIIIPAAMLAVGVALVGSVSSTLAWYQYSTKAQAAFIGTSVGFSEGLEIKTKDGEIIKWKSNVTAPEVNKLAGITSNNSKELIPITTSQLAANGALPLNASDKPLFYSGIETGVAGYGEQGNEHIAEEKNYVQFDLNIRYKKTDADSTYLEKSLKLIDLTITDESGKDLSEAVRVHFAAATQTPTYKLFAKNASDDDNIVTATYGNLDTDGDEVLDKKLDYEFNYDPVTNPLPTVMYGIENTTQTAYNAKKVATTKPEIGVLPANNAEGLKVTVTIWIEGWQKLGGVKYTQVEADTYNTDNSLSEGDPGYLTVNDWKVEPSAIWNPTVYSSKIFNVGMRFQAEDVQ